MNVQPWTSLRAANSETTTLTLAVDPEVEAATITDMRGALTHLEVTDNTVTLPVLGAPDRCELDWLIGGATAFTVYVEVVEAHYFPLDQLRHNTSDGQDAFLETLDEETLFFARQAATDVIERNANRSFVHRVGRTKDYGGSRALHLADGDVYEVLTEGYHLASDALAIADDYRGPYPVWVEYLYGYDQLPSQVSRAALELATYMLRPSNRPIGATGESTDAGYIHFTTAGADGATDVPEVNAAIQQWGRPVGFAW